MNFGEAMSRLNGINRIRRLPWPQHYYVFLEGNTAKKKTGTACEEYVARPEDQEAEDWLTVDPEMEAIMDRD